jgi:hypothetical protein
MEAIRTPEPPSDDQTPSGLARLELMVNTVLDRLTAPEGPVCDEPDASATS